MGGYGLDTDGSNTHSVWYNSSALPKWQSELYDSTTIDFYLDVTLSPCISPAFQTLVVEDEEYINGFIEFSNTAPPTASFQVQSNCYLSNLSVYLRHDDPGTENATVRFLLYNSTWDSINTRSIPGAADDGYVKDLGTAQFAESYSWVNLTCSDTVFLNNSKTENKTWFIGLLDINPQHASWFLTEDIGPAGDASDDSDCYTWLAFPPPGEWIPAQSVLSRNIDFPLKITVTPYLSSPNQTFITAEDVNLRINNTEVINQPDNYNSGYWMSSSEYQSSRGFLGFTLTADWWDVSCTITSVQIVYTKTDVIANSSFTVVSGQEVLWYVTDTEGLNYLDTRIIDTATINFTIPTSWDNINVFNGTINKTDDIILGTLNTGYNEVCLLNAGSGDWFLTASSVNLLASIDSYRNSSPETLYNYSDVVHFNVTFQETIFQNDGLINLSIYGPALINDVLNFTLMKTIFVSGQEISLGDWDISDNVTQYGVFRVQVSWHNGTAIGFLEVNLTITGESELLLIEPPQNAIYGPNHQFSIIVYYEDAQLHKAISGAVMNFNIADQGWEATNANNGTTGYYVIPVDCSKLPSSVSNCVEITATREFYSTPTLEYLFEISESTTTTTTTTTTTQPDTSSSTTATTTTTTTTTSLTDTSTSTPTTTIQTTTSISITTTTETGTFPGGLTVLVVLGTLVIFIRRRKKI